MDDLWFCSELVAAAYERQGVSLTPVAACYVAPADLALSGRLELTCILER